MLSIEKTNRRALELAREVLDQRLGDSMPTRFLFVTISGAHLYGFPSSDSDIDLRGAHVLPVRDVIGLDDPVETWELQGTEWRGAELDFVSHDIRKYLRLMLKKNGYILEQILSPLVVHDSGVLGELQDLARGAITRHVAHHYRGFYRGQRELVVNSERATVKATLYMLRVLMTGIRLLRTGRVEANILRLNEEFEFSFVDDLVGRKVAGEEQGALDSHEKVTMLSEAEALEARFEEACRESTLPEEIQNRAALNDFLLRERLKTE